ncbi:hypothetical protein NA56DRAFT_698446 [Hyaloscypha hepaticicola]|uniref:Uncharacterized protein n=1 Tax=Hyaloscypha hepaticicola TaxID=2082293 RepID=A0A2J6QJ39_9HELO|nr:hypothetical protein NA56DRAFT_698446 [Hyaloscypha hepaticicola]
MVAERVVRTGSPQGAILTAVLVVQTTALIGRKSAAGWRRRGERGAPHARFGNGESSDAVPTLFQPRLRFPPQLSLLTANSLTSTPTVGSRLPRKTSELIHESPGLVQH